MDISIISFIGGVAIGAIITKLLFTKNVDISFLEKSLLDLKNHNAELLKTTIQSHSDIAVAREQLRLKNIEMENWERTKKQFIDATKSSSLEATKDLTKQILEQHDQQSKRTADETEKRIEKSTKDLYESHKELFSSVNHLKQTLDENNDTVETIKMAISSSASVGYASETILESTLVSLGLTKDIDFFTQMSIDSDNKKLRPDAVVFLPGNNTLVIDSKSSKFIWEVAEAERSNDQREIDLAYKNLKSSMDNHFKSLTSKDYAGAIKESMKKMGKDTTLNNITVIMWLPNDGAVDKVLHADSTFTKKASASNIFVCGITGLWMAIGMASQQIRLKNQSKNSQKIMDEAEKLLNNISIIAGHSKKVSKGLNSANSAWDSFVKSFDGRFISGAKRIEKLGAKVNKELTPISDNAIDNALEIEAENQEIAQIEK